MSPCPARRLKCTLGLVHTLYLCSGSNPAAGYQRKVPPTGADHAFSLGGKFVPCDDSLSTWQALLSMATWLRTPKNICYKTNPAFLRTAHQQPSLRSALLGGLPTAISHHKNPALVHLAIGVVFKLRGMIRPLGGEL